MLGKYSVQSVIFFHKDPEISTKKKKKRCLLLGRKVVTNIDSILKNRNITLPTKIHLVKSMAFPVGMYVCESWTINKVEC